MLTFSDGGQWGLGDFRYHGEAIRDIYMVMLVPEPGGAGLLGLGVFLAIARGMLGDRGPRIRRPPTGSL